MELPRGVTVLCLNEAEAAAATKLGFENVRVLPLKNLDPDERKSLRSHEGCVIFEGMDPAQLEFSRTIAPQIHSRVVLIPSPSLHDFTEKGGSRIGIDICIESAPDEDPEDAPMPLLDEFMGTNGDDDPDGPDTCIVPGLVPRGVVTILGGPPKVGKTFLIIDLMHSVASGTPFCGHWKTHRGRVMALLEEDTKSQIRSRFRWLERGKGTSLAEVHHDIALEAMRGWRVDDVRSLAWLEKQVTEFRPTLLIIDALSVVHSQAENDSTEMIRNVLGPLKALAARHNCAVLLIHHFRNLSTGQENHRAIDLLRGSGAIKSVPRAVIGLRPHPAGGYVMDAQGNQVRLDPVHISMTFGYEEGRIHSTRLQYEGPYLSPAELETIKDRAQTLYRALLDSPGTLPEMAKRLEIQEEYLQKSLDFLRKKNLVTGETVLYPVLSKDYA